MGTQVPVIFQPPYEIREIAQASTPSRPVPLSPSPDPSPPCPPPPPGAPAPPRHSPDSQRRTAACVPPGAARSRVSSRSPHLAPHSCAAQFNNASFETYLSARLPVFPSTFKVEQFNKSRTTGPPENTRHNAVYLPTTSQNTSPSRHHRILRLRVRPRLQ